MFIRVKTFSTWFDCRTNLLNYVHNRLTLMYIQINYLIHYALQVKIANVCFDARNIELLKDLCNDKRTQIFAIKIVL